MGDDGKGKKLRRKEQGKEWQMRIFKKSAEKEKKDNRNKKNMAQE